MSQEEAPTTTTKRGRRLRDTAPDTSRDNAGCVMHHVRLHHTLDAIIRKIVQDNGLSFRDASEQALIAWAGKMGHTITEKETEIKRVEIVKVFVSSTDAGEDS